MSARPHHHVDRQVFAHKQQGIKHSLLNSADSNHFQDLSSSGLLQVTHNDDKALRINHFEGV